MRAATSLAADTSVLTTTNVAAGSDRLAQQAQDALEQATTQKDYEDAAELFERAVAADPDNYEIRRTLGWVYLDKLHRPEAAYWELRPVVAHRPDDMDAKKLLGMAALQTGRPGVAVRQFRKVAEAQPDDLWIQASLGRALAQSGSWMAADHIYDQVLAKDPKNAQARLGKAELAAWRGESGTALEMLNQLLAENPSNVEALTLEADIHRWQWDLSKSKEGYQQVLSIDTNNVEARQGLREIQQMSSSDVEGNIYYFKDTTLFTRESAGGDGRLYLANPVYLLGGATVWRFNSPGIGNVDRIDGEAGLEIHWARWLETSVQGDYFKYEHLTAFGAQDTAFGGGQLSTKLTPITGLDIYTTISGNQPFISSISTVTNAMKQNAVGNGVDLKLWGPLSVQNSFEIAKLTDNNLWVEEKPQISLRVLKIPETYLRVEYDYLDYRHTNALYWSPQNWHILWPVFDTSIPLFKNLHIDVDARAPYVFNEHEFGYQFEVGPSLELFNHIRFKASYYQSRIPGDQGAWSGKGGQGSLSFLF